LEAANTFARQVQGHGVRGDRSGRLDGLLSEALGTEPHPQQLAAWAGCGLTDSTSLAHTQQQQGGTASIKPVATTTQRHTRFIMTAPAYSPIRLSAIDELHLAAIQAGPEAIRAHAELISCRAWASFCPTARARLLQFQKLARELHSLIQCELRQSGV
jgi:hypothetical protein